MMAIAYHSNNGIVTQGKYQWRTEEFQNHVGGKAIAIAFEGISAKEHCPVEFSLTRAPQTRRKNLAHRFKSRNVPALNMLNNLFGDGKYQ
ncbi:hypothetical protein H5410_011534 [Solanum commersonii]|uniref:Uncharacterized protein n=1 Tax=Solanum commersonii TaxID=4109 RepID=A0A9J6APM7_SOLCO|nr:hypothetical protein H5410_011534 [Solanum commersonii]